MAHVSEKFCPLWWRGKYCSRCSVVLRKDNCAILLTCFIPFLFSLRPSLWVSEKKSKDIQRCHCVITNSVKLSINLTTSVRRSARKGLRNEKCYFYRHPRSQNSVTVKESTFKKNWKCSLPVCLAKYV